MIGPKLSPLEDVVSLAAHDFKVSGVGQRTRAALRRNLAAVDETILPDHLVRSIPGPDLVRQLNTLELVRLVGSPFSTGFRPVDRELVRALQSPLSTIGRMIGYLWSGPLSAVANTFVGIDSVPIPHSTTYPGGRSLAGSDQGLPRQIARVLDRIGTEVRATDVWTSAVSTAASLSADDLNNLKYDKAHFEAGCSPTEGELVGDWQDRIAESLKNAVTQVPAELLAAEQLIAACVETLVSLSCWDHQIDTRAIRRARPKEITAELPAGFEFSMAEFTELAFLAMGSSFRLLSNGKVVGIGATAGSHFEFSRLGGKNLELSVIRLCGYETVEQQ